MPRVTARSERYSVTLGLARMSDSRSNRAFSDGREGLDRLADRAAGRHPSGCNSAPGRSDLGDVRHWPGRALPASARAFSYGGQAPRPACRYPQQECRDLGVAVRELLQELRDGRVLSDQRLEDRPCGIERLECLVCLADRVQRVADRVVAMGEFAAEFRGGRVVPGQLLEHGLRLLERSHRLDGSTAFPEQPSHGDVALRQSPLRNPVKAGYCRASVSRRDRALWYQARASSGRPVAASRSPIRWWQARQVGTDLAAEIGRDG